MAKNYSQVLLDLSFLSKRYGALLELGNDIEALQVLLNQKESLEGAVASLSKDLEDTRAKVSKAKADLKKVQDDIDSRQKAADTYAQGQTKVLEGIQAQISEADKQRKALLKAAEADASKIVSVAEAKAAEVTKAAQDQVSDANSKLAAIENRIAQIKATL